MFISNWWHDDENLGISLTFFNWNIFNSSIHFAYVFEWKSETFFRTNSVTLVFLPSTYREKEELKCNCKNALAISCIEWHLSHQSEDSYLVHFIEVNDNSKQNGTITVSQLEIRERRVIYWKGNKSRELTWPKKWIVWLSAIRDNRVIRRHHRRDVSRETSNSNKFLIAV